MTIPRFASCKADYRCMDSEEKCERRSLL